MVFRGAGFVHYTSAQSPCSFSFCFTYFLFQWLISLRVQICIFCWNNLISAYIAYVFRFLDLPSLKLISRFLDDCLTRYSLF